MEEELYHSIFTHNADVQQIDQISFTSPVVVTALKVGAVPTASTITQHTDFINLFARDLSNVETSRFTKLCDGFMLPTTGSKLIPINPPIVTDLVLLRGQYQTVPITLLGHDTATAPPLFHDDEDDVYHQFRQKPVPGTISATEALERWVTRAQSQLQSKENSTPSSLNNNNTSGSGRVNGVSHSLQFTAETVALLQELITHWDKVKTSDQAMHNHTLPLELFTQISALADSVCLSVATDDDGEPPTLNLNNNTHNRGENTTAPKDTSIGSIELQPAWLEDAIDMSLGWMSLFAAKAIGRTPDALHYAASGLAIAVVLCSHPTIARHMLIRHSMVFFSDILTMPQAPGSYVRHAVAACLLTVNGVGALGIEAALGWWKPKIVSVRDSEHSQKGIIKNVKGDRDEEGETRQRKNGSGSRSASPAFASAGNDDDNAHGCKEEEGCRDSPMQGPEGETISNKDDYDYDDYNAGQEDEEAMVASIPQMDGAYDRWEMHEDDDEIPDEYQEEEYSYEDDRDRHRSKETFRDKESERSSRHHRHRSSDREKKESRDRKEKKRAKSKDREKERRHVKDEERIGKKRQRSPSPIKEHEHEQQQKKSSSSRYREEETRKSEREKSRRSPPPMSPSRKNRSPSRTLKTEPIQPKEDTAHIINNSARQSTAATAPSFPVPQKKEFQPSHPRADPVTAFLAATDRRQTFKLNNYWSAKQREFSGCYSAVAQHAVRLLPPRTAAMCQRLLSILRFYERAGLLMVTALDLIEAHDQKVLAKGKGMSTREVALGISECVGYMEALAETLAKPVPRVKSLRNGGLGGQGGQLTLRSKRKPEEVLIEAMAGKRVLQVMAALLAVPAAHAAQLVAQGDASLASQAETALAQQISLGVKALLSVVCSTQCGLALLQSDPQTLPSLLSVLQPANSTSSASSEVAAVLQSIAISEAGIHDLVASGMGTPTSIAAVSTLLSLCENGGETGKRAVVHALARHAGTALPRLMQAVHVHCTLIREACGLHTIDQNNSTIFTAPGDDDNNIKDQQAKATAETDAMHVDFTTVLDCGPAYSAALDLLEIVVCTGHADVASLIAPEGSALGASASAELSSLDGCTVAGVEAAENGLSTIAGAAQALDALHTQAIAGVLELLHADLPTVVDGGIIDSDTSSYDGRLHSVTWEAAEEMFLHRQRFARCIVSLRLLTSVMWEEGTGLEAAAVTHQSDGLHLLLRAVLVASELVAAAQADRLWVKRTGAAIDPSSSAQSRHAALEFAAAASSAMSVFLQQARSLLPVSMHSVATMDALIKLHALLSTHEDSIICMLNGTSASAITTNTKAKAISPALSARVYTASALRCFVEAAEWTPPLLPTLLFGVGSPVLEPGAATGLSPSQLFTTASLLGDIFPSEWPPPGRKPGQAPPSQRKYRTALAKGIEACSGPFQRLLSHCCASEPILFRAAGVRVFARASGLGGGMGPFIVAPLVEALRGVPSSQVPLHDARRLLEMLVPLSYRPAIKAALLDSDAPKLLAAILNLVVSHVSKNPGDAAEAMAVCTMAMESVMVLCNSEVGLNPMASKEQAGREETPTIDKAVPIAKSLLQHLPSTGANAVIGHRILRLLASYEHGRMALRIAAVELHATQEGKPPPPPPPAGHHIHATLNPAQVAQAAQSVANRYWQTAESLPPGPSSENLKTAFLDVVTIMQEACATMDSDRERDIPPAPARFVAALQASLAAAAETGILGEETRWEGVDAAKKVTGMVFDPATRMFWKNVKARHVTVTAAASAAVMRKYTRLNCEPDVGASIAGSLHPPLTRPSRPLFEWVAANGADIPGHPGIATRILTAAPGTIGNIPRLTSPGSTGHQQQQLPKLGKLEPNRGYAPLQLLPLGSSAPKQQQQQQQGGGGGGGGASAGVSPFSGQPSPYKSPHPGSVSPSPYRQPTASPSPLRSKPSPLGKSTAPSGGSRKPGAAAGAYVPGLPTADLGDLDIYADLGLGDESLGLFLPSAGLKKEQVVEKKEPIAAEPGPSLNKELEEEGEQQQRVETVGVEGAKEHMEDLPTTTRNESGSDLPEAQTIEPEPNPPAAAAAAAAPPAAAAVAPPSSPPSGQLPTDPQALAALLQNPAKLQQLLEKNPALLTVLKSKMGK